MNKLKPEILTDSMIDEISDEIVESLLKSGVVRREKEEMHGNDGVLDDTKAAKIKNRIKELEGRLDSHINDFKVVSIETERMITEKVESMNEESERQILALQEQIEDMRTAMIRLSNEIKRMKGE